MTWLSRTLHWVDLTGNLITGGSPNETISARVGYHASYGWWYWRLLEAVIDWAFYPLDGDHHCLQKYIEAKFGHYQDVSWLSAIPLAFFVLISCPIIASVTYWRGVPFVIILALFLTSCDNAGDDSDPRKVQTPNFDRKTVTVTIEVVPGWRDLTGWQKATAWPPKPGDNTCRIVIDPEFYTHSCIGHEIRHCFDGYWHDEEKVDC